MPNRIQQLSRIATALSRIFLAFIFLASIALSGCDDEPSAEEAAANQWHSPITSAEIVNEIHEKEFKKLDSFDAKNLAGFSINKIKEIHQYFWNQRFTTGGDVMLNHGTNFDVAAEDLQIPVPQLKEADSYYYVKIRSQLTEMLQGLMKENQNIELDSHNPLYASAYCGINTVEGGIILRGTKKDENELKAEAAKIAERIKAELPAWVDGFKLSYTNFTDTVLKTSKTVDVGFLWRRGEAIRQMKASEGLWGYIKPTENKFWHTSEWNDLKEIQHPEFKEIHPAAGNKVTIDR